MNNNSRTLPTLSLITICKNSGQTIQRTINSIISQKTDGIEYLIIDGCSTDDTIKHISAYSTIDCFVSEPDSGIVDAFNKGIMLSTGDIIGLINADDQLTLDSARIIRHYFDKHPEVEVVHGDVQLLSQGQPIKRVKPAGRWWYPWRLVLFNHPATFVRRSVYTKHGLFDSNYQIAMDVEIFLRWMSKGVVIRYLPEVLALMETGGISSKRAVTGFREARTAALQHLYNPILATLNYLGKRAGWLFLKFVGH